MKIVIFVDYSNKEFNKDFVLSNSLISKGHNVFLAVNDIQFRDLLNKCDIAYLGMSADNKKQDYPSIGTIDNNVDI